MSLLTAKFLFGVLDVTCVVAIMCVITGGHMGWAWFSAPLLLGAQSVFFGMLFANMVLDGHEEEERHEAEARKAHRISWQHPVRHA